MSDSWNCPRKKRKDWVRTHTVFQSFQPSKVAEPRGRCSNSFQQRAAKKKQFLVDRKITDCLFVWGQNQKYMTCSTFSLPTGQHAPNVWASASRGAAQSLPDLPADAASRAAGQIRVASSSAETNGRLLPNHRGLGNATPRSLRSLRWQRKARRIDPGWSLEETGTSIQAAAAGPRDDSHLSDCQHSVFWKKKKKKFCSTK